MLTLDKIYHAAFVLKKVARKTDLIRATKLSKQCELYLKTENLQETGSFKLRGAYYKISQLTEEEKSRGIIACSAGNHAQGVAMAATQSGIQSLICMPDGAPISKVEATKQLGAEVRLVKGAYDDAYATALSSRKIPAPHSSIPLMTTKSLPARAPSAWRSWMNWKIPTPLWSPSAAVD